MSTTPEELQDITNRLVADVTSLKQAVDASDTANIPARANTVETDANDLDRAVHGGDIPPDHTMILSLSTQLLLQVADLQAAITSTNSETIAKTTDAVVLTTSNINRCVTRMAEVRVEPPPALPIPPWFLIPTTGGP